MRTSTITFTLTMPWMPSCRRCNIVRPARIPPLWCSMSGPEREAPWASCVRTWPSTFPSRNLLQPNLTPHSKAGWRQNPLRPLPDQNRCWDSGPRFPWRRDWHTPLPGIAVDRSRMDPIPTLRNPWRIGVWIRRLRNRWPNLVGWQRKRPEAKKKMESRRNAPRSMLSASAAPLPSPARPSAINPSVARLLRGTMSPLCPRR
mmetsp:Transcript_12287/g.30037  ORF Transcript_12287/g.30037 Transcript_12287/m.30037 type:complete len:202 (+) Transcript_12287:1341-1946(+)